MSGGLKMKSWEIGEADWDLVKAAVKSQLVTVARDSATISYSGLVRLVGYFAGPDSHALAEMLGEINREEAFYRGMPLLLSAVVTHKDDEYPGIGFFTAAEHLGKSVPEWDEERRVFWANELAVVFEAYGPRGDR